MSSLGLGSRHPYHPVCQQQRRGGLCLCGAGGGGRAAQCLAVPVCQRAGDFTPGVCPLSAGARALCASADCVFRIQEDGPHSWEGLETWR